MQDQLKNPSESVDVSLSVWEGIFSGISPKSESMKYFQ